LIDTATTYLSAGLCVLPAILEEKRPALSGWKQYQRRLPTERQVRTWFAEPRPVCVLTGAVSGHLEMIDFDHGGELYNRWAELVTTESPELLARLIFERSQSGGWHAVYRCAEPVPGNRKLAQRIVVVPSAEPVMIGGKRHVPRKVGDHFEVTCTLIETRGEGGLFLCAPTPGYQIEQGSFDSIPVLEVAEQAILIEAARTLNEAVPAATSAPTVPAGIGRPGDDFNERGDVREVLVRHGWSLARGGENECWRRPGKDRGWSATLRDRVLYVFSSNASPFEPDRAYAPFTVFTLLEHGGDFTAAANALRSQGYGQAGEDPDVDLSGLICGPAGPPSPPTASEYPDPGPMPDSFFHIPGFVAEVMDHCLATAPYPNLALAFCGALSLQAVLAGRKVRDQGDNRTNIYLLALAYSSVGKDWPRKVNTHIMHRVGLVNSVGEKFASGEGIQDSLFINPSLLFQTDEIDGLLQSINKARDARYESIMGTLLTMYSSANSIFPMRRKAGKEAPGAIDQPCLVVFGTAIPNHYYEALSERMLTNGFFARMIVLECGTRSAGREPRLLSLPGRVLETARWWADFRSGTGNLENWHPVPQVVPHTDEARAVLIETRLEAEVEYAKAEASDDSVGTAVWGRASEHARKLALIYAVSENNEQPEIGKAATAWASRLVLHQARRMLFMAQSHVADNPFQGECLKLLRKLRAAPAGELSHSALLKRMKMDAKSFMLVVGTLEQRGDIVIRTQATATKSGRFYQLAEDTSAGSTE